MKTNKLMNFRLELVNALIQYSELLEETHPNNKEAIQSLEMRIKLVDKILAKFDKAIEIE